MAGDRLLYKVFDFESFRLIRTVIPRVVSGENLSIAVWKFLSLYDTDLPFAVISDYSGVEVLLPDAVEVLGAVIVKSYTDPRLLAAAWVVGENDRVGETLKSLLLSLARDPDLVVRTDADAVAILNRAGLYWPAEAESDMQ